MAPIIQTRTIPSRLIMAIYHRGDILNMTTVKTMSLFIHKIPSKAYMMTRIGIRRTIYRYFQGLPDRRCTILGMTSYSSFSTTLPWINSRPRLLTPIPHQRQQLLEQASTALNTGLTDDYIRETWSGIVPYHQSCSKLIRHH
jgi:hypothetical protein